MVSVVWVAYSCITRQRRDTKYLGRDVLPQYPELAHVQTIPLCLGARRGGLYRGGQGEGWVLLKISLAVTVSLAAASHLRHNGVPPQFREGVAPLTGARVPS